MKLMSPFAQQDIHLPLIVYRGASWYFLDIPWFELEVVAENGNDILIENQQTNAID